MVANNTSGSRGGTPSDRRGEDRRQVDEPIDHEERRESERRGGEDRRKNDRST